MGQPTQQQVKQLMPDSVIHAGLEPGRIRLVLLHGWGADAEDLLPLGDGLAAAAPVPAECIGLQAPEPHPGGQGRQWYGLFPSDWQAVPSATQQLRHRIEELDLETIPLSKTVLIGFSQGGAMALHVGCDLPLAGVISCSGYPHPGWKPPSTRPPVLLLHGRNDDVVPAAAAEKLFELLRPGSNECSLKIFAGGHTIPLEAQQAMAESIVSWLQ
ncbi:phospholipase/carboxylesterase [Synechococcus sp. BIOS-E4-1]|nr:phospholipase/carboxylesterase [Synechococcus sp. BIOS-E4-1]